MNPQTEVETEILKLPIVYSKHYDIKYHGLEKIHAFDAGKWKRIVDFLIIKSDGRITKKNIYKPKEATHEELLIGHTEKYLSGLKWSYKVAAILEVVFVALIPNFVVDRNVLRCFRYQVKGTMMAAKLALEKKWAINIGGGFHHASKDKGGGFCIYADISIAIKSIQADHPDYKFLIVDLDAHQGNGHERDFPKDGKVYIMDIYNRGIYPHDEEAKKNISVDVPLISWTTDSQYMSKLKENLNAAFEMATPDLVIYNAGTDCLIGDPLGRLDISEEGVIERDEVVFQLANERGAPIVMVTSGGYQYSNAEIIANSIMNLLRKNIIE